METSKLRILQNESDFVITDTHMDVSEDKGSHIYLSKSTDEDKDVFISIYSIDKFPPITRIVYTDNPIVDYKALLEVSGKRILVKSFGDDRMEFKLLELVTNKNGITDIAFTNTTNHSIKNRNIKNATLDNDILLVQTETRTKYNLILNLLEIYKIDIYNNIKKYPETVRLKNPVDIIDIKTFNNFVVVFSKSQSNKIIIEFASLYNLDNFKIEGLNIKLDNDDEVFIDKNNIIILSKSDNKIFKYTVNIEYSKVDCQLTLVHKINTPIAKINTIRANDELFTLC